MSDQLAPQTLGDVPAHDRTSLILPAQQEVAVSAGPQSQAVVVETPPPLVKSLRIYGHSSLIYWWPVWVAGYVMAAITYWGGQPYQIGQTRDWFYAGSNLGVIYLLVLFGVIVITSIPIRGMASGMVIMGAALVTVLLAYYQLWDQVLSWFGDLRIHINLGAYFWFSTLLFGMWLVSVFLIDRVTYWDVTPGQVTQEFLFGGGSKSYDTNGMVLEKHREDLFRHWLLGLGSGDLQVQTTGARHEHLDIPNVMFLSSKLALMEKYIAQDPSS